MEEIKDKIQSTENSVTEFETVEEKPVDTTTIALEINGHWGIETTKKIQQMFGLEQTGEILNQPYSLKKYLPNAFSSSWKFAISNYEEGDKLIKRLQEEIGENPDGFFGLKSVRSLQAYVDAPVTGYLDETAVKAFQEWLNQH